MEAAPEPPARTAPAAVTAAPLKPTRDPRRRLVVAGASVFAGTYLANVGVALWIELLSRSVPVFGPRQESSWWGLYVPVVGPIIAAADPRNATTAVGNVLLLIGDAVVQASAVAAFVVGLALPAPKPEAAKPTEVRAWLAPLVYPGGVGATLGLQL
jgi:hypothetical protein